MESKYMIDTLRLLSQSEKSEGHIYGSAGETLEKVLDEIKPVGLCKVTGDVTYWTDYVLSIEEAPVYSTETHKASWKETVVPNLRTIGNLDRIIPYMRKFLTPYKIKYAFSCVLKSIFNISMERFLTELSSMIQPYTDLTI